MRSGLTILDGPDLLAGVTKRRLAMVQYEHLQWNIAGVVSLTIDALATSASRGQAGALAQPVHPILR